MKVSSHFFHALNSLKIVKKFPLKKGWNAVNVVHLYDEKFQSRRKSSKREKIAFKVAFSSEILQSHSDIQKGIDRATFLHGKNRK